MKWYIDITLLPDAETNIGFLWQKVYQKIHMAFVEIKSPDNTVGVAVSFPGYGDDSFPLGAKLRIFSPTSEQLEQLDIPRRLKHLSDYCHCTSIKQVPVPKQFACFSRQQFKTNIERRARRRMKSTSESFETCVAYLLEKGFEDRQSNLPYINLESSSTQENQKAKHRFRLFVNRVLLDEPEKGQFNCYGLSKTATVPWF